MNPADITGLILCGGAASRLGGQDKGLVPFHGKPLIDIAIERLSAQVNGILISANRNISQYESRGFLVLKDASFEEDGPRYDGPLAGIFEGLGQCPTDWLCVTPCDCPLFPEDLVGRLAEQAGLENKPAFVKNHPSFSLLPRGLHPMLGQALQRGQRKLGGWLESVNAVPVDFDESGFKNLNSPDDF